MNLSWSIRNAFVKAALQDVPQVDYVTKITDLAQKLAFKAMPALVQRVYTNPETRGYIHLKHLSLTTPKTDGQREIWRSVNVPSAGGGVTGKAINTPEMHALMRAELEQEEKLERLRASLMSTANSVRTRKQLIALLPEFEKYLPPIEEKTSNLPAIANLVADFINAGWPKAEAEAAAKAHAEKLEKAKALQKTNRAKRAKKATS